VKDALPLEDDNQLKTAMDILKSWNIMKKLNQIKGGA